MDCSPPGSSAHGIFQARVLESAAIAFSNETLTVHKISLSPNWEATLGTHSYCDPGHRTNGSPPNPPVWLCLKVSAAYLQTMHLESGSLPKHVCSIAICFSLLFSTQTGQRSSPGRRTWAEKLQAVCDVLYMVLSGTLYPPEAQVTHSALGFRLE